MAQALFGKKIFAKQSYLIDNDEININTCVETYGKSFVVHRQNSKVVVLS